MQILKKSCILNRKQMGWKQKERKRYIVQTVTKDA